MGGPARLAFLAATFGDVSRARPRSRPAHGPRPRFRRIFFRARGGAAPGACAEYAGAIERTIAAGCDGQRFVRQRIRVASASVASATAAEHASVSDASVAEASIANTSADGC